jgi:hypothetical protein
MLRKLWLRAAHKRQIASAIEGSRVVTGLFAQAVLLELIKQRLEALRVHCALLENIQLQVVLPQILAWLVRPANIVLLAVRLNKHV